MASLFMFIATGGYAGYLPKAPGTWGSLVGLALYWLLHWLDLTAYLIAVAVVLVIGTVAAGAAEKIMDRKDPGLVVIDEIAGMLITLIAAPADWRFWILGFILFRFFDIVKPFPVNLADRRINGGTGIMLDDVIAGLYSLAILQGIAWLFYR